MNLTGSSLDRAEACPPSCALPSAKTTNPYAETGSAAHGFLRRLQDVDRDEALAQIEDDDHRAACEAIDTDGLPLGGLAGEVTFAFDTATGEARELGRDLGRDYSGARPTEICATLDVVAVEGDVAYIGDYKGGWREVPAAKVNRQIHIGVVCAALVYDVTEVIGEIIRTRPGAPTWTSRARFDVFELGVIAADLSIIRVRVLEAEKIIEAGGTPDVVEGEHCRYCPSIHRCPAKLDLVVKLASGLTEKIADAISPETAAAAWKRLAMIDLVCKRVREQIETLSFARPIALGGGRYLGPVNKKGKESLDGDKVYARVQALYGEEIAELSAPSSRKALKKTIGEALHEARNQKLISKMAPAERALLEELRKPGGGATRAAGYRTAAEYRAPECATDGCSEQAMEKGGTCNLCAVEAESISAEDPADEIPFGKELPPPDDQEPPPPEIETTPEAGALPGWANKK